MKQRKWGWFSFVVLLALSSTRSEAKTVRYELVATRGEVNLSGKEKVKFAIMLNGQIPAPTLEFTEGDDAEIELKNHLSNEEISVHWHGILLPPLMDGVPYVNTPPIRPGESFTFKFKLRQHGTYWYHSHTGVQEQKGIYGAMIIHPKEKKIRYDRDLVVVMSDWTDENPDQVLRNLKKDGDYYLYKKDTVRSWFGALQAGRLGTYLENERTRMGGMDLSDVGYDAFLINGKRAHQLAEAHPGEKVRIRLINAAASSYFYISLGKSPMLVISSDGLDIAPTQARELLVAPAETYDVLFTIPDHKNYELRITAQDGTGSASGWIGMGEKVSAPLKAAPDLYAPMGHGSGTHGFSMSHDSHSSMPNQLSAHSAHQMQSGASSDTGKQEGHGGVTTERLNESQSREREGHGDPSRSETVASNQRVVQTLTVDQIRSPEKTAFPKGGRIYDLKLALNGDMDRYVWLINGKAIHEDYSISINEGEIIRFTFVNETMMHHPFHLHGHFYRVLNEAGEYSPLKHTVDIPPMGTRTIEFIANEPGDWMLHCHILYHLKTGMARVVRYASFKPDPIMNQYQKLDPHLHDHWYGYGTLEAATNHAEAFYRMSQTWNQYEARFETRNSAGKNFSFNEEWELEGDLFYRRWFDRFFNIAGGATYFNGSLRGIAGVSYLLPLLFESQLLVDHRGGFRFDLEKRFQWTSTLFTDADLTWRPKQRGDIEEPFEFEVSLMYSPEWSWAAGLMLTEDTLGAGVQIQF